MDQLEKCAKLIKKAKVILIGAGSGLSTSAGFEYSGERFKNYFQDFIDRYHFQDMYEAGFYPYTSLEEYWAYWSRYVYYNRYLPAPKDTYKKLYDLVKDKDYFVLTTNVDHQFQEAGFDKKRLFYTQGDYGLFQCSEPCHQKTYDNQKVIEQMVKNQKNRKIPTELIPHCPICGKPMTMNLRCDDTFVEDEGWHHAMQRYVEFRSKHRYDKIVYLELGVGMNTPGIIKYPFYNATHENPSSHLIVLNNQPTKIPLLIKRRTIELIGDIDQNLDKIKKSLHEM